MTVDTDLARLLSLIQMSGHPPVSQSTVEEARRGLRVLSVDLRDPSTLPEVSSVSDIVLAGSIPARVYRPAGAEPGEPLPTVVFYHGGGWVIGDLDTHDGSCRLLANEARAVVVSVGYRLAPEHHYPAAVHDSTEALTWVVEHVEDFGADESRVAVAGDSAGGNLAAVCAQIASASGLPLAAQLLIYPATDLVDDYPSRTENETGFFLNTADARWFAEQYLGVQADDPDAAELVKDPQVSPLRAKSLAGLAPAVVITAQYDPLRDEGNAYAAALRAAGVPVVHREFAGLIHGFWGMEVLSPAAADAMTWAARQLGDLLR